MSLNELRDVIRGAIAEASLTDEADDLDARLAAAAAEAAAENAGKPRNPNNVQPTRYPPTASGLTRNAPSPVAAATPPASEEDLAAWWSSLTPEARAAVRANAAGSSKSTAGVPRSADAPRRPRVLMNKADYKVYPNRKNRHRGVGILFQGSSYGPTADTLAGNAGRSRAQGVPGGPMLPKVKAKGEPGAERITVTDPAGEWSQEWEKE